TVRFSQESLGTVSPRWKAAADRRNEVRQKSSWIGVGRVERVPTDRHLNFLGELRQDRRLTVAGRSDNREQPVIERAVERIEEARAPERRRTPSRDEYLRGEGEGAWHK